MAGPRRCPPRAPAPQNTARNQWHTGHTARSIRAMNHLPPGTSPRTPQGSEPPSGGEASSSTSRQRGEQVVFPTSRLQTDTVPQSQTSKSTTSALPTRHPFLPKLLRAPPGPGSRRRFSSTSREAELGPAHAGQRAPAAALNPSQAQSPSEPPPRCSFPHCVQKMPQPGSDCLTTVVAPGPVQFFVPLTSSTKHCQGHCGAVSNLSFHLGNHRQQSQKCRVKNPPRCHRTLAQSHGPGQARGRTADTVTEPNKEQQELHCLHRMWPQGQRTSRPGSGRVAQHHDASGMETA